MIIFIHVSLFSFSPFLINRSHQELHMRQTLLPHVLPGRQTGCSIRRRHVSYLIYIHMPHLLLLVLHLPFKSTFLAVLLYIVLDFMYKYGPEPDVFFPWLAFRDFGVEKDKSRASSSRWFVRWEFSSC